MRRLPASLLRPWRPAVYFPAVRRFATAGTLSSSSPPPIVRINNGTFYRDYPTSETSQKDNPPLYPDLKFSLPSAPQWSEESRRPELQHWAVIGSSGKAKFLQILRGAHICIPPRARSFPYLAMDEVAAKDHRLRVPSHAIQYVGFNAGSQAGGGGIRGSYLSARYESRREDTDFTVLQYLKGQTELNPLESGLDEPTYTQELLDQVIADLRLEKLVDMPVANLSNGQTRRSRIAKALLESPEVLLLDEPFMGLDPPTVQSLSPLLHNLALKSSPRLVISLRPQDQIPEWITHLVVLGPSHTVALQGTKKEVFKELQDWKAAAQSHSLPENKKFEQEILHDMGMMPQQRVTRPHKVTKYGEPVVQMDGVRVRYGDKTVLGGWSQTVPETGEQKEGLHWEVRRGQRWGVFGLNGSGKTTLISLITSDHPQTYGLPVRLFGRSRLPEFGKPGISIFDLQARIGHSSPEIHGFFPRNLSVRAAVETAWADTFLSKPVLNDERNADVDAALRFFEADLNPSFTGPSSTSSSLDWATSLPFSSLTVAQQRLILFLRALLHKPDLVILDEAFAGMPRLLRDKCLHFLEVGELRLPSSGSRRIPDGDFGVWNLPPLSSSSEGQGEERAVRHRGLSERQALIVISHVKEEVPDIVAQWMLLPSPAEGAEKDMELRMGELGESETVAIDAWDRIWGVTGEK